MGCSDGSGFPELVFRGVHVVLFTGGEERHSIAVYKDFKLYPDSLMTAEC